MADNVNLENLLQMGISAAKKGNADGARVLLQQVLDEDKKNDRAWVWLAYVAKNEAERQKYLDMALRINPNNKAALKAMKKRTRKRQSSEKRMLWIGGIVIMTVLVVSALLILIAVLANGG